MTLTTSDSSDAYSGPRSVRASALTCSSPADFTSVPIMALLGVRAARHSFALPRMRLLR